MLNAVANGWHRPKDDELEFRGDTYEPDDAKRLLKKVEKELDQDYQWIATMDRKVYTLFFQMALHIDRSVAAELYLRYEFHMELQNIWFALYEQNQPIESAVHFPEPSGGDRRAVAQLRGPPGDLPRHAQDDARDAENRKGDVAPRPEVVGGRGAAAALIHPLDDDLIESLSKRDRSLSLQWIINFLAQFRQMKEKVGRIHFKSLAGILGAPGADRR